MAVSQCGQAKEASGGVEELDNSPPIRFLSGVFFVGLFFARVRGARVGFARATLLTVIADPVNLKGVASSQVMVLVPDFLLDVSYFGGEEFNRCATFGAHHVVMAAAIVLVLEARDAVMEGDFAGEATTSQEFQRTVDGGKPNTRVFLFNQAVKFVGGKMLPSFNEGAQDGASLTSLLEADAAEMLQKNRLGLA
jgi:hypothetical protein